jgi:streptogramin lyase
VEARLQQPKAIGLDPQAPGRLISDSGNDAQRMLRLGAGEQATFQLPQPLHAPSGLAIADRVVWIADTDAHAVLRLDTQNGALRHVPIGE